MTKNENKELLFSVTQSDCIFQATKGSGPGGQHRNKTSTAIRCIHKKSGAVGYSCDDKSQHRNKRKAFRRMAESKKMQDWIMMEAARQTGQLAEIERSVDRQLNDSNLIIEGVSADGKWEEIVKDDEEEKDTTED